MSKTTGKRISGSNRPHHSALLLAGLASVVAWMIPVVRVAFLPIQYLNTHLHEMCHALAALATGGVVECIVVLANGSGTTPVAGGSMWIVAPAGYVGASIIGALIILNSRSEAAARTTLRVIAFLLFLSQLMWVRGDAVGVVSGWVWVLALFALSGLRGLWLLFAAQLIGLQQCLNSVQSLYELLEISALTDVHSDAKIMQQATAVPATVWAIAWCAFSLVLVAASLSKTWKT